MNLRDAPLQLPSAALPGALRQRPRVAFGRDRLLQAVEATLEPLVLVLTLWGVTLAIEGRLGIPQMILALVVFSLAFPSAARLAAPPGKVAKDIVVAWLTLAGLLFIVGYATHSLEYFEHETLVTWVWAAPACVLSSHFFLRLAAPTLRRLEGGAGRALIAGMNDTGLELARRLQADVYANVEVLGFVDDRSSERLGDAHGETVLGPLAALPGLVQQHRADVVYLALPMASQDRILRLLDGLRDTTASLYFVPDMFITELIQGRIGAVNGMPVVGVCDTPFSGVDGLIKRASDIVLASLVLVLIAPLLVALAAAVKLTSPGPVIFRQRRYGLDGDEITVYKFRTMRVTEDGVEIRQCGRGDPRVTPLGAFMRRTSLDELPQFINVLQGRMSIVGPRPHAVAHNEMYRKLIKGYMQRHKVRPGITGWAQVNGLRGETQTIERMKARVEYDLDYLRNWSLRFDLLIIARTIWVVLRGQNAY
jgi:putative colanic acid biosysnthesis UDP-glucose lipid carrier transferase